MTIFASLGLTIISLVFIVFILSIYFFKKKNNSITNPFFVFMLFLTFIVIIFEIFSIFTIKYIDYVPNLNFIITKLYMLFVMLWIVYLFIYIMLKQYKKLSKNNIKQTTYKTGFILFIFNMLLLITIILIPFEYKTSKCTNLYTITGDILYFFYIFSFISIIVLIIMLNSKNNIFSKKQKLSLYCSFYLFLVSTFIKFLTVNYNDISFIFTFTVISIYFAFESQDSKLLIKLKEKQKQSSSLQEENDLFLVKMSDEIKTPLDNILKISKNMLQKNNLDKNDVIENSKHIYNESKELLDLINNILDILKLEDNMEEIINKNYNLRDLILKINDDVNSKLNNNLINFRINVDEKLPTMFNGDSLKIKKIIVLILISSLKYTKNRNIYLNISGYYNINKYFLKFEIYTENGEYDDKYFDYSFNDFIKLSNSSEKIDNYNLGLLIAKKLIDLLHGKINLQKQNNGFKYVITLCQEKLNNDEIGKVVLEKKEFKEKFDFKEKKVLIVDDNELNIMLLKKILDNYNLNVLYVKSGLECIESVKNNEFDLIFLDHMMPQMDGVTTLKKLKNLNKSIPKVIMLTANTTELIKDKYKSQGFYGYLSKPINLSELNKILNDIFNKK